jgi:Salmonella virulence plasmid 65kDa B protein
MSKSDAAQSIISLSKEDGAMNGMGEKFAPDPHTGTGNFTVPIAIQTGRDGFQPQLSLAYSTGNDHASRAAGTSFAQAAFVDTSRYCRGLDGSEPIAETLPYLEEATALARGLRFCCGAATSVASDSSQGANNGLAICRNVFFSA